MSIFRVQIGFPFDSVFPRDVVTINPHYNGSDAQALANALKANLSAMTSIGATTPFTIKVYNATQDPPSYPLATAAQGTGFTPVTVPAEVALCLSFYGGVNRPSTRGRLYIPATLVGGPMGKRPTGTQTAEVGKWATTLGKNLPTNTFWTVYSRKMKLDAQISAWWVDDEWDTVRSRGLRPTTRVVGALP